MSPAEASSSSFGAGDMASHSVVCSSLCWPVGAGTASVDVIGVNIVGVDFVRVDVSCGVGT
jgi:hypothetical protein